MGGVTPREVQGELSLSAAPVTRTIHGGGESALLEAVLERSNMLQALRRVERNSGAPGVDRMTVAELRPYLRTHWARIREDLLQGGYRPCVFR